LEIIGKFPNRWVVASKIARSKNSLLKGEKDTTDHQPIRTRESNSGLPATSVYRFSQHGWPCRAGGGKDTHEGCTVRKVNSDELTNFNVERRKKNRQKIVHCPYLNAGSRTPESPASARSTKIYNPRLCAAHDVRIIYVPQSQPMFRVLARGRGSEAGRYLKRMSTRGQVCDSGCRSREGGRSIRGGRHREVKRMQGQSVGVD
jgi:hypothetical protein